MFIGEDWLTKPAKSFEQITLAEHLLATYGTAKGLVKVLNLSNVFTRYNYNIHDYLWASLFHDVGKIKSLEGHARYTDEVLPEVIKTKTYKKLLETTGLEGYIPTQAAIQGIREHHNATTNMDNAAYWVYIADSIASAQCASEIHLKIIEKLKYFARKAGLNYFGIHEISLPSISKHPWSQMGRLLLHRMLLDCVKNQENLTLLFQTRNGCRVIATAPPEEWKDTVGEALNKYLERLIKKEWDIFFKSKSQEMPYIVSFLPVTEEEFRRKAALSIVEKLAQNIRGSRTDGELSSEEALAKCGLPTNFFYRLWDETDSFFVNGKPIYSVNNNMNKLKKDLPGLMKKWAEKWEKKWGKVWDGKVTSPQGVDVRDFIMEWVKYRIAWHKETIPGPIDLKPFIQIDGSFPFEQLPASGETACSACGTFKKKYANSTVFTEKLQHDRATLFRMTNEEIRNGTGICPLCTAELLIHALFAGLKGGNQLVPHKRTHLILFGLGIKPDEMNVNPICDEVIAPAWGKGKLHEGGIPLYEMTIFPKEENELQIILYQLDDEYFGLKNETYASFVLTDLAEQVIQQTEGLVLAIAVETFPRKYDSTVIQLPTKEIKRPNTPILEWFRFMDEEIRRLSNKETSPQNARDAVLTYYKNPVLGLGYLARLYSLKQIKGIKEKLLKLKEAFDMVSQDDKYRPIALNIWRMARWGNMLAQVKGTNIGKFLSKFHGDVNSFDAMISRLLTKPINEDNILNLYNRTRQMIAELEPKERKGLASYLQKTKYLYNALMWTETQEKDNVSETPAEKAAQQEGEE